MSDFISDTLTRLRNANSVYHNSVNVKYSKLIIQILNILKKENYIMDYKVESINDSYSNIKVFLKYKGWWIKTGFFNTLIRISKPGKRVFSGYKEFKNKVKNLAMDQGVLIISTSSGIMTHSEAIKMKSGGEILFYIS